MPTSAPTSRSTAAGLRALLAGLVDYAGLFPPAGLPLDDALERYLRDRRGADAWMLGRFVIAARRLPDLAPCADRLPDDAPLRLSLVGPAAPDALAFQLGLDEVLAAVRTLHDGPVPAVAEALEMRLPPTVLAAGADAVEALLDQAAAALSTDDAPQLDIYFEVPFDDALRRCLPAVLEVLAARRHEAAGAVTTGLKFRCGGLEPSAYPDAADLAFALVSCRDAGVRFKATAGLHHPLRHFREAAGAKMHGFVNVFGGAVLAAAHGFDAATMCHLLEDGDADHFRFTDDGLAWNDLAAPVATIDAVRETFALSFGSCSFDEPREDLRRLGWLA